MIISEKLEKDPDEFPPAYEATPSPSSSSSSPTVAPIKTLSLKSIRSLRPKKSFVRLKSPTSALSAVRDSVFELVRDLVSVDYVSPPTPEFVLFTCQEACRAYDHLNLSLSELLQEKSIEGHAPIYWAILNRPHSEGPEKDELINTLLHFCSPLSAITISEIRLACLQRADQPLFQRLRHSPQFTPFVLSAADGMLLGTSIPPDAVTVETTLGDPVSFIVHISITHFQKRMRVSNEVAVEFIAKSRLWRLSFCSSGHTKARSPTWALTLSLLPDSPPTFIDSQLLIQDVVSPSPLQDSTELLSARPNPRPPSPIILKSSGELVPPGVKPHGSQRKDLTVTLKDSIMQSGLQQSDNPYISPGDIFKARWEARLEKPQSEGCVIS